MKTINILSILFIFVLSFEASSSEQLSGTYYFTQYIVYEEKGIEVKADEGILYISRDKFSKDEVKAIKKTFLIENATEEWLNEHYNDKDICIATTPKPPGARPSSIHPVISKGKRSDNKISIQVRNWPDWAYYINLELTNQTLTMSALGGSRAFGHISERFEVTKIRNFGLKTCLSMKEATNNIWWPTTTED